MMTLIRGHLATASLLDFHFSAVDTILGKISPDAQRRAVPPRHLRFLLKTYGHPWRYLLVLETEGTEFMTYDLYAHSGTELNAKNQKNVV